MISKFKLILIILTTAGYWFWESQAEGNIRIDILVLYPLMSLIYLWALWQWLKFKAIIVCLLLLAINYGFLMISYDLFDKFPG